MQDNQIATAEVKIARYLTRLLNERPEVSLKALLESEKVETVVGGVMHDLQCELHILRLKSSMEVVRYHGGRREVWVSIEPE